MPNLFQGSKQLPVFAVGIKSTHNRHYYLLLTKVARLTEIMTDYKYIGYVGCYTEPRQADPFLSVGGVPHDESKVGKGILAISVSDEGKLEILSEKPVVSITNPSYLELVVSKRKAKLSKNDRKLEVRLCTVSETEKDAKVAIFKLDPNDPTRTTEVLADFPSFGSYPCHISQVEPYTAEQLDQEWYIAVCNYGRDKDGSGVSLYGIAEDNVWVPKRFPFKGDGSGKDKNRQQGPHAHSSVGFLGEMFVADLGSDTIVKYELGQGDISKVGSFAVPSGSGPRSLSFSNQQERLGVVSLEMAGSILLVRSGFNSSDSDVMDLEACGHPVSILPADWPKDDDDDDDDGKAMAKFNNGKWASDVVWSKNGKYVFAAARLHNSIAIFEVLRPAKAAEKEELPKLSFVRRVETKGKTPRCLTLSPGGEFLLICHQHSHDVTCFKIDETNGSLDFVDKIDVPLASCVKLIENKCGRDRFFFENKSSDKPRAKKPKV